MGPHLVHDLARRFVWKGREFAKDLLREKRLYVACQTDDNLPYVLQYAGEDNLLIGTDYGHADTSSELLALQTFRQRTDIRRALSRRSSTTTRGRSTGCKRSRPGDEGGNVRSAGVSPVPLLVRACRDPIQAG